MGVGRKTARRNGRKGSNRKRRRRGGRTGLVRTLSKAAVPFGLLALQKHMGRRSSKRRSSRKRSRRRR